MAKKRTTGKAASTAKKKVAKKATKKTAKKATKKAAKKAPKKKAAKAMSEKIDPSKSTNFAEQLRAGMQKINAVAKSRAVNMTMGGDLELPMIPVKSFMLQYALGTRGIPAQQIHEIIAAKYTGKSTFIGHLIGDFTRGGHPCAYFECEGKPPLSEWFQRLASRDKAEGEAINRNMAMFHPRSLPEMVEGLKKWGKAVREHTDIPDSKTIVAFIDPWSKLMSQAEADGVSSFGVSDASKKKERQIGEGSNQGHAKFAHEWMRKITLFMEQMNITLFVVKHQNQEGVMGGGPQYSSDLKNETAIGGEAIGQNAALRIIGAPGEEWKDSKKNLIGNYTRWRVHKTSFGHGGKEFKTRVRSNPEMWRDTDTHYDVAFDYSDGLANWMALKGHLGTTVDKQRFTCESIGAYKATCEQFEELLMAPENEDYVEHLGFSLGIYGFVDIVAQRQAEAEAEERRVAREKAKAEKEKELESDLDDNPVKAEETTEEPVTDDQPKEETPEETPKASAGPDAATEIGNGFISGSFG